MSTTPPTATEVEHDADSPSSARKYIDAVLEQSFRHLFGPTATPEQPRRHDVVSIAKLTSALSGYLQPEEIKEVKAAFHFSDEAHLGQYRQSGEPYITHPVAVAEICAGWNLDAQSIMAALLHDVMEDQGVTKAELAERFGAKVAELVDGLSKLDKMEFRNREEAQAENFRKMLLAMARDVRVILVKLADRLHNMRTLGAVPAEKRRRVARETLDIYAPIAHRLGLNNTYRELQDLSFANFNPHRYATLEKAVKAARGNRREVVGKILESVQRAIADAKLDAEVTGREKNHLQHLQEDARQAAVVLAGARRVWLSRRGGERAGVLHLHRRSACAVQARAGQVQGLHRNPEGERLPIAAHHAGRPVRRADRVSGAHAQDARNRRSGRGRALAVQERRRRSERRAEARAPMAQVAARHSERSRRLERIPRARQDRSVPRRGVRVHAEVEDHGAAARRHGAGLRVFDPQRPGQPVRRGEDQQ
ncbi:protein of unknown function [Paraburkholderia dioscoreae]|uniref:HD domain-containing protein n=1 Tax=Paraburkholderia dioscoreae TaxID=2604047 RepID=A0A5Q4Z2F2_9BURK|nr:protein of unknown function [Paraburkholderia dioscoreae]